MIELACAEYGEDKIDLMVDKMVNGESLDWFDDPSKVLKLEVLRKRNPLNEKNVEISSLHATSKMHQLEVLLKKNLIKAKRDPTMIYNRIAVNVSVAVMLGLLFIKAGNEGSRVLANYNLLFAILIHHMMTTKMLTILTCKYL